MEEKKRQEQGQCTHSRGSRHWTKTRNSGKVEQCNIGSPAAHRTTKHLVTSHIRQSILSYLHRDLKISAARVLCGKRGESSSSLRRQKNFGFAALAPLC